MSTSKRISLIALLLAGFLVFAGVGLAADNMTEEAVTEKAAEKVAEKVEKKVTEKAVEEVVEKVAKQVQKKATAKAVEKAAEKAVEKAEAKAEKKSVEKAERPTKWWGPTEVHFIIFVVDIDSISGADQNFAANVYISLRWKDERLASPDGGGGRRRVPLNSIWNPRILLVNQTGLIRESLPEVVDITNDGMVTYRQRYVGKLSQPLRLSEFPLDKHRFVIQFVAVGYAADELKFVPDVLERGDQRIVGGGISDRLSLPDWTILEYEIAGKPYEPIKEIKAAGFTFEFVAKRQFLYYLWQVIVPLAVIVIMSWSAFWIDPSNIGAQIGVASSSVLTLIAYRFLLANLLPRLPYMTRMDYLTLGSTLLVFLALMEVVLTSTLNRSNRRATALWIDRTARLIFPLTFAALFIWSMIL